MAAMLWPITLMPFTLLPISSQGWPEGSVLIPAMPDILGSCCHAWPSSVVSSKAPIASAHSAALQRCSASALVIRYLRGVDDIAIYGTLPIGAPHPVVIGVQTEVVISAVPDRSVCARNARPRPSCVPRFCPHGRDPWIHCRSCTLENRTRCSPVFRFRMCGALWSTFSVPLDFLQHASSFFWQALFVKCPDLLRCVLSVQVSSQQFPPRIGKRRRRPISRWRRR